MSIFRKYKDRLGELKVASLLLLFGAAAIIVNSRLDYTDTDNDAEYTNINNSKIVRHVAYPGETTRGIFESVYHVSETSNNYKLWLKKFSEENEMPKKYKGGILKTGAEYKVPVLRQLKSGREKIVNGEKLRFYVNRRGDTTFYNPKFANSKSKNSKYLFR